MGIANYYLRNIKRQVKAVAIWPISVKYNLGDYGYYVSRRGKFSVRGNIFDKFGLKPEDLVRHSKATLYYVFNSSNTLRNDFQADVESVPARGTLDIEFEEGRSYVFHLFGAKVSHMVLNDSVKDVLIKAAKKDDWHHRYRIVDMVYICPDIRFVYSLNNKSSVKLSGEVDMNQKVSKGTVNYQIVTSSHMESSMWIEGAEATPLVTFASFKRRELVLDDEKVVTSDEWYLQPDSTDSYVDLDEPGGETPEG